MRVIDFFDRGALLHPDRPFMIAEDGAVTTHPRRVTCPRARRWQ